jgi:uncharacterized protein YheU (UPF0270 family)
MREGEGYGGEIEIE